MCLGFTAHTLGSTMELFRHPVPFPSSSSSLSSSHTLLPCYFGHFLPSFSDSIPRKMKLLLPANPTSPCLNRSSPKQASERLAMVIAMRSVEVAAIQPKLESRNVMETLTSFSAMTRKPAESANVDSITVLHRQLDKMQADIPFLAHGREWQDDYSAIMVEKLKETRKQGMMLMNKKENRVGEMAGNNIDEAFYGVDPATLIPGEIVVHKARGVAKFVSTKNELNVGKDEPVEYVYLQYADGMAKLKSSQARRLLYRYFQPGENGKPPTLSKLNDSRQWEKKKRKGRLAIQKMVRNLMLLYIQRLKQMRPPYPKNEALMAKFAAKFPYHPTPDQEQAFFDVERDMTERGTPMDRLVCGDVGFGKTEVALRAIFRVVCAGKQAMVLAPTTVLAKQHYEVIRERFASFNYKVALLSRFQKTAEKKDVVKQIKDGTLNIVVGTHALLGKSIAYNNLGLLVVDEEHRFGVKQKERITSFKTSVDVLTLSATPIPRTLYLALSGFRDASLIATPPPERVPIQTHLCQYDENLIKSAIDYELSRGGQVFYVVPRIKSLAAKQEALEMLFPDNTIGVAHGKQSGNILEETFDKFSSGKIDILLCTNIIESGLDIQRVNTIVVEDVQLFGLAQLHQLRGRVGRADQESHAYLVYPDKDRLTDEAVERLVAIEECCGIGQGFKLAERDLLLRGFGSIFGEMQSGEVAHIGIDLFFEMLFDSLSKAEKSSLSQLKYKDVELDIEVETIIPSEYIADKSTRQILYQKLEAAASKGIRDLMQFTRELRSEYGKEPPSFELTLKAIYIKRMASNLGIYHIEPSGKTVIMETNMNKEDFEILMDSVALESMQSSLSFQNGQIELKLLVELPGERMLEWIFIALMELHKGIPAFVM